LFSDEYRTAGISLSHWIKANSAILFNALSLVGTTAVTSVLGFAYWWWAARQFSPAEVGLASAAISAMALLGTLSILGLDTLLIGELPRQRGREASLMSAALLLVGGVGGCLGVVFAFVAPFLSKDFEVLKASIGNIALFAAGVSLAAMTLVFDKALIGLLRGGVQLWRNALFAVSKFIALIVASLWLLYTTALTIYTTWVIGIALSFLALAYFSVLRGKSLGKSYQPQWGLLQKLGPQALKHHLLNLTLEAPSLILPVLVTALLSAQTNAWFYVSWSIASLANIAASALTTALYAASSAQPATLPRKIRLTLSLAVGAAVLANCVLFFGTKQILELFGHSYAEQAVWSLRILGVESFPFIIKTHYITVRRIERKVGYATLPAIAGGVLELGASALGAFLGGLTGLSLGWLLAMCIEGACMTPTVYRAARPRATNEGKEEQCAS
jgi:O-antigen/teichoic acid export membrane protein